MLFDDASSEFIYLCDESVQEIAVVADADECAIKILERGFEYIASIIGILRAGAAYSPLSTEYPKDRVAFIIKDSGADFAVDAEFLEGIEDEKILSEFPEINMEDAAIAIYTSGSTGNPKGILHDHWSFTNGIVRQLEIAAGFDDVEMSVTPFNFAISTHDILTPLWAGAEIHILTEAQRKDILFIDEYIDKHNITASVISPQLLKQLPVRDSSLKLINSGGERISGIYSPYAHIKNAYGLSEVLSIAMTFELDKAYDNTPIGRPLSGFKAYLLDENGKQVPDGEEGELCLAGTMARGYINLPEQTAKVFANGIFHSGDLARQMSDGQYQIIGRISDTIKINGKRVEPTEVEEAIKRVTGLEWTAVRSIKDKNGMHLAAYHLGEAEIGITELREKLGQILPYYMLPSYFVKIDSIPRLHNGKMNRKALPRPAVSDYLREYAPPTNETEEIICQITRPQRR